MMFKDVKGKGREAATFTRLLQRTQENTEVFSGVEEGAINAGFSLSAGGGMVGGGVVLGNYLLRKRKVQCNSSQTLFD